MLAGRFNGLRPVGIIEVHRLVNFGYSMMLFGEQGEERFNRVNLASTHKTTFVVRFKALYDPAPQMCTQS